MNKRTNEATSDHKNNILEQILFNGGDSLPALHDALKLANSALQEDFSSGQSVESLIQMRAEYVDMFIRHIYQLYLHNSQLTIIAVGGYGRGELHPCSDIDLLILSDENRQDSINNGIGKFIATLWDIGLNASHSVRTIDDCISRAKADVGIATNLLESRYIIGDKKRFTALHKKTCAKDFWPTKQFFTAKYKEQQERHTKYHDTPYSLEPNIKEAPGGLRDIQMISWIAKRHFGTNNLNNLVLHGFLTEDEYSSLRQGLFFLWRVRFALHLLHGRCEDRLLFDSQVRLAHQFGYMDTPQTLGVEHFMQDYYKTVKELELLNEMLLQLLEEAIYETGSLNTTILNDSFAERAGVLLIRDLELFKKRPAAMLELFHLMEQYPHLKGVSAVTLRYLRSNLKLIDSDFREDPDNRLQFMQILKESRGVTHELRRMNRYGVLAKYLPAFDKIVGRMQYDLYHAYTVDEHILFVISNLRKFMLSCSDHNYPMCSKIMQSLPKPELAYIAALFHDIAKGSGGDHSTLGAEEAQKFCLHHGLSQYDARLTCWLVKNHLMLSLTAQKKDINEPQVIHDFAVRVGDQIHLDYLYVLTVADICGTNPELWNNWKASLCVELYNNTSRTLFQGLENPIDKVELVREVQQDALAKLDNIGMDSSVIKKIWSAFSEEYFLHHSHDEIIWHTSCLADQLGSGIPQVYMRQQAPRGGTTVCIYSTHDDFIFGRVTATLAELGLTVLDARLTPMKNGEHLDTYVILEDNGEQITNTERLIEIKHHLNREINRYNAPPAAVKRRAPRQVRMFTTPTEIHFTDDTINHRTVMEISAADRPGLLSLIGQALGQYKIHLRNAKISTIGERAEDVFFITDSHNKSVLDEKLRKKLSSTLLDKIGESS